MKYQGFCDLETNEQISKDRRRRNRVYISHFHRAKTTVKMRFENETI